MHATRMIAAAMAGMFAQQALAESVVLIQPESGATGTPVAVVWIQGANYSAYQYTQIAQQFQLQAAEQGYKAWIGIPDFTFSTPNPATIDKHIESAMKSIIASGYDSDAWFLAAHSLGGVMTQDFLKKGSSRIDASVFDGQILMSSVLLRSRRAIDEYSGMTVYDYETPTLTIGGSKDGLMRVTRVAESYWHQTQNISEEQANLFPVEVLEGVAHYQFAGGVPPSFVQNNDLRGDISDDQAQKLIGATMASFIDGILTTGKSATSNSADEFFAPFVEAMYQEGSEVMKEPCYQSDIINVPTPSCIKGSPWIEERALKTLVGDLADPDVTLVNNDNFHRASSVTPYHHPELSGNCRESTGPCTVTHISVSQNVYDVLNELDLGKTPIASNSMRVKFKSSQWIHREAREEDADFDALDKKKTECQTVNKEVLDWAYEQASQTAKDLYDTIGEPLVEAEDREQPNGGLWIYEELEWKEASDKSEMDNVSVSLVLDQHELVPMFKSMHYCKVLSPFRALEWIYVDSQYANGGYLSGATTTVVESEPILFLTE